MFNESFIFPFLIIIITLYILRNQNIFRKFLKSKLAFNIVIAIIIVLFLFFCFMVGDNYQNAWWPLQVFHDWFARIPDLKGFTTSILASLIIAWGAYHHRHIIRKFFRPNLMRIKAPLQVAIAPLIIGRSELNIWEKHDLNMELEFTYSGVTALNDMLHGEGLLAVASDVALCLELGKDENKGIAKFVRVIPFVKITNHIKIIYLKDGKPHSLPSSEFQTFIGKIGYFENSVHEHFLDYYKFNHTVARVQMNTVLQCYQALMDDAIQAFAIWEPHYQAFNLEESEVSPTQSEGYTWFLCLIGKEPYIKDIKKNVLSAMLESNEYCKNGNNVDIIAKQCTSFLNPDFTGINTDFVRQFFTDKSFSFDISEVVIDFSKKLDKDFGNRINSQELIDGSHLVIDLLWEGLNKDTGLD